MTFNKEKLTEILRLTAPAIQETSTLPSLQYICFRDGKAMTTNLQLSIIIDIDEKFTGLLPFKLLYAIIQNCDSDFIEIEEKEKAWILTDGIAKHKLGKSEEIKNFPAEPVFSSDNQVEFNEEMFINLQNACKFEGVKTSGAEGCYIGEDIVGTNGIYIYKYKLGLNCSLHIPSLFVKSLNNKNGMLQYSNRFVSLKTDSCTYITTQLEAKYPKYNVAFEQFEIIWNIKINPQLLLNEINKIMAYLPTLPQVGFSFKNNECLITYTNIEFEQEYINTIPCLCSESYARFNIVQLQTVLSCFNGPEIEIAITGPSKSVYLREVNNQNTITLIQPVV